MSSTTTTASTTTDDDTSSTTTASTETSSNGSDSASSTDTGSDSTSGTSSTSKDDSSSSTTTSSSSSSSSSTSGSSSTSMPKVTTTSSSSYTSSSSSSTTWTTPSITPPSTEGNPYIWTSDTPSGLVFITVGAVAGFIFASLLLFLLVRRLMARRAASQSIALSDTKYHPLGKDVSREKLTSSVYDTNPKKVPLLYEADIMSNSLSDLSDINKPMENFSTLDVADNNKRKSMFLSPTAEVMALQKKQQVSIQSRLNPTASNRGSVVGTPDGSSFYSGPGFYANADSIVDSNTEVSVQSPPSTLNPNNNVQGLRGANRQNQPIPSVYLESMFDEK